jgi:hypothetical protein
MNTDKTYWTEVGLRKAHKASSLPVPVIQRSVLVGCFSCYRVFPSIDVWDNQDFAWCPHCSIDSILPEGEVPDIHRLGFLKAMNELWF